MTTEAAASMGFLAGVTISAMLYVILCLFAYYREMFTKIEEIYQTAKAEVEKENNGNEEKTGGAA
jgi:hypothetical protein